MTREHVTRYVDLKPGDKVRLSDMTKMERAALDHARDWLRYQNSPQYRLDVAVDRKRRESADKAAGHLPSCSLTKCSPDCRKSSPLNRQYRSAGQ